MPTYISVIMALLTLLRAPVTVHRSTTTVSRSRPRVTTTVATLKVSSSPRAAERVAVLPSPPPASGPNWAALRQCESGGDYGNKHNPLYRGAYQFDRQTWASVGGSGDPADAPPDEQDARAQALYRRSGRAPWPVCGRRL